jgi:transcriptional regulator with XRE-family HTH domain
MTVAALFREAREAKGMSQEALAAAADVSVSTVIRMEGGKLMPLASSLFSIATALDVPLEQVRDAVQEQLGLAPAVGAV